MDPDLLELNFGRILPSIASLVMPEVCVCCHKTLGRGERHLCSVCASDFPYTRYSLLEHNRMADSYNEKLSGWIEEYEPYAIAAALYFYSRDDGFSSITREIKYHRRFALGRHFGKMLGETLASSPLFAGVDAVVPVPLHPLRKWRRGYNQAEIIAEAVSDVLGCRCFPSALRRVRRTRTQTRLSGAAKAANVRGAFARGKPLPAGVRHVLLVDDVYTSGSTLSECHKALRKGLTDSLGPERGRAVKISVATLAFVGG